jgi:hypothetical protein
VGAHFIPLATFDVTPTLLAIATFDRICADIRQYGLSNVLIDCSFKRYLVLKTIFDCSQWVQAVSKSKITNAGGNNQRIIS